MKKKIANMISTVTNGYLASDDDVSREQRQKDFKNDWSTKTNKEEEGAKSMTGSPNVTLYWTLLEYRNTRPRG